ncbi:winged helix DNA-binding domain-containing protein [Actinoplanes sp. CA-015351]|uniref:winged helix DNA-binding domain-containing protein n=1 Tax=Actinoplanes sp. CA-015351 TaxID=3239897 RepID=UPI003D9539A6
MNRRALNRATLARQLLLERADLSVPEALTRLGGLQAQTPHTWYAGLWSRLRDYSPADTAALLSTGEIVRMALMRSTIHLVTVDDCRWLRPLVEPVIIRSTMGAFGRHLRDLDRAALVGAAAAALAERPMTFSELGKTLAPSFPGRDPGALAQAARMWMPLVQVPPRGLWGRSGKAAHAPLALSPSRETAQDLFLRYLAAFGPATVRDAQQWSGLTRLASAAETLRPKLITFRDADGRELFDLPDAPRPDPDTPAPARFLYDFDNLLLSHADRTRITGDTDYTAQGWGGANMEQPRSILLDGFVAATWRIAITRREAVVTIRPFRALTSAEKAALEEEGTALALFNAPAASPSVVFAV